ncbi:MAG: peptide chain release factor N(5)-glutamine methyltransferase [Pseudomonadota bacterium]
MQKWTILKTIQWAASYMESIGIPQPRADAEVLLAHALGLKRTVLYINYDKLLQPSDLAAFNVLLKRRTDREPVAYILGKKEFWSMEFLVTPDVLIPRPETEFLVEATLPLIKNEKNLNILELGTGSGAIICALATECPYHNFYAVDCSAAALSVARINAQCLHVDNLITFFHGNWFEPVHHLRHSFNIIISNPPYIKTAELTTLAPEILLHEPKLALNAGDDGLDAIRTILHYAPEYLIRDSAILLEVGSDQQKEIELLFSELGEYKNFKWIKDYSGHYRVIQCENKKLNRDN